MIFYRHCNNVATKPESFISFSKGFVGKRWILVCWVHHRALEVNSWANFCLIRDNDVYDFWWGLSEHSSMQLFEEMYNLILFSSSNDKPATNNQNFISKITFHSKTTHFFQTSTNIYFRQYQNEIKTSKLQQCFTQ